MSEWSNLTSRIRSINARITTVGRIYGKDSSIYQRMIDTIQKAGGNTRFKGSMFEGGLRQVAKATRALETIENSQYTTRAGRKAIGAKARETFMLKHDEFDDNTLGKMYDVFQNSSFARFEEVYKGSSELMVDLIMNAAEEDDITSKDLVTAVNYFTHHLDEFVAGNREEAVESFRNFLESGAYKYAKYM